ncbi:MAG: hypothetical protein ACKVS6_11820 [Planctomycetota bacterium]
MFTTVALLAFTAALQDASSKAGWTGLEKTQHFEIHFRPGSRAEASVDRVVVVAEEDLNRIVRALELKEFTKTIRLYLYDDVAELQKITGVPSGGHSTTLESHVPYDNDQTRLHELVHVVAEQFPEKGNEPRNLFHAEGLANAVLKFVTGVPVDAVAAFYKKRKRLPALAEMTGAPDFYTWLGAHPGFNGYDVAGSFYLYLLESFGAAKVRAYYKGTPAKVCFGKDTPDLERGWHARLDKVTIRAGLEKLLEERLGGSTAEDRKITLTDAILGPAKEWKDLSGAAIEKGDPGEWDSAKKTLITSGEKSQGDWSIARLGKDVYTDAIARFRAEPLESCFGVQLQIGEKCQALVLRGQGTFIYTDKGGVAHSAAIQLTDKPVEIVLRRQDGRATVWIDGVLLGEADVDAAPGRIGVGSVGGKAKITRIAVRKL